MQTIRDWPLLARSGHSTNLSMSAKSQKATWRYMKYLSIDLGVPGHNQNRRCSLRSEVPVNGAAEALSAPLCDPRCDLTASGTITVEWKATRSDDPRQDGEEIWTKRPVEFDRSLRFSDTEVRRLRVLPHGETI